MEHRSLTRADRRPYIAGVLLDCVVVGAGPAGLATSLALTRRNVDHVVLERGRVGHTWRTQRWDSLRLNNPGWMNPMLGAQPLDTYLRGSEVVHRLDRLAAGCPIREAEAVTRLHRHHDIWLVHTAGAELRARTVVVATAVRTYLAHPSWLPAAPAHRTVPRRGLPRTGTAIRQQGSRRG